MEIDKFLIGLTIFGFIIGAGLYFITDAVESDNIAPEADNSTEILQIISDKLNDSYMIGREWSTDLDGEEVSPSSATDNLISNAFTTVKRITASFDIIGDISLALMGKLPIPPIVRDLITTIVIISVMGAIIFLMFRFQPR